MKKQPPPPAPFVWERADPAELAKFDPLTKVCTMNCGQGSHDPRSRTEIMLMCDDCKVVPANTSQADRIAAGYNHMIYYP